MKGKIWQEMRSLSAAELEAKLNDIENEMFTVKFRHSSTPVKNPLVIRNNRRTIAKIKTLLKEKKQENINSSAKGN